MPRICGFPPIENKRARILILGSMPGEDSLRASQYYAHRSNVFWRIMGELIGAGLDIPYARRVRLLEQNKIALWDVLASCERKGSLDSGIRRERPNDFASFFPAHPQITHILFNGRPAEKYFLARVQPSLVTRRLRYQRLPSSSPAYAAMPYPHKLAAWRKAFAETKQAGSGRSKD